MSKKRNLRLVALASAAVLAVFAAGYLRTRSAALRFAHAGAGWYAPVPMMDVATLPGQVGVRQSAETAVVSGARLSSDAFHYAVIEASKQPK